MTLSPVFRSEEAIRALKAAAVWKRLIETAEGQAAANATIRADLHNVLDSPFIEMSDASGSEPVDQDFIQQFFFLILFRSLLQTIGVSGAALDFCSEVNFCIKGTITAADNLFDDQDKSLLPLRSFEGTRFRSILQLLAFERLTARVIRRGIARAVITDDSAQRLQLELLSRMAAIGSLEGSEERGVEDVLEPELMIERVHRVRGGALFELAFIAPGLLVQQLDSRVVEAAQRAISKLGTAFQIVDDLTDFEADLVRGSHNLLVAQISHCGSQDERRLLQMVKASGSSQEEDLVAHHFADSGRAVIERGEQEALEAMRELHGLGFWFPPDLSHQLVRAIVSIEGIERVRAL